MLALPLLFLCGSVQAQTITNIARASWTQGDQVLSVQSNAATFEVTQTPVTLDVLQSAPGSPSTTIAPSLCGGHSLSAALLGTMTNLVSASDVSTIKIGQQLIFRLVDHAANRSTTAVDQVDAVITTISGDREVVTVLETSANSGIFIGAVPTTAVPPTPVQGDCRLSVASGDKISIELRMPSQIQPIAMAAVNVLADPYGVVFDSEDGTPINGVRISMVDALTGAPAKVFGDDGLTPYPSTIVTGETVTDAAGNLYPMPVGEYRFPLAPLGSYRLVVEPPSPYVAPSKARVAQLSGLTRPDGGELTLGDSSFGARFSLSNPSPVRVDIPVDRPGVAVALTKTVSAPSAVPGDVVYYTVLATNTDGTRAKRDVVLSDTPSPWLRLRAESIRVDGTANPAAITVAADGHHLTIRLGTMPAASTHRVTYAMTVRADAPPGQAVNRAEATDSRGLTSVASAVLKIDRETIAGRMTLIGRITEGACSVNDPRLGIPGVRVMLEDGSFAITDRDGRYHFEGLIPGTHVVAAQETTLPQGSRFVDCSRSTRNAGSTSSRFVMGQGGSLIVADFSAVVPPHAAAPAKDPAEAATDKEAAGGDIDWLTLGDGPTDFLFPATDYNPRAPAVRIVIRHRASQKVDLSIDGKPVDKVAFDGAKVSADKRYAVSVWRGIPLDGEVTHVSAVVRNLDGSADKTLTRDIHFTASPARVEIVAASSKLVADGSTRPMLAVRVLDRSGRPVHSGLTGQFAVNAPYESAQALDAMQSRALTGLGRSSPTWTVKGDDGIALIELAPTMVSGAVHLDFTFANGELKRQQTLEAWIVPGQQKWTLVGLAEGSVGEKSVADNMERTGRFDSDLGDHARVAFYAKGRVLGRYLLTLAYDSAKQADDQRLLGAIDPNAYYTVFADGSDRRFDAASRKKIYVRIETGTFYALFGDITTGFDQTVLGRYQRTTTGLKGELHTGGLHAEGFAARVESTHRRDEFQGGGISGPYRLTSRAIIANSENVTIEVRDRFRSELVVKTTTLTRFIDYDIDLLSGTISFKQPILSRDADLNPQFIVIDYELDTAAAGAQVNAGGRADYTTKNGKLRVGGTVVSDKGDDARTTLAAMDVKARVGEGTELRAEAAASRKAGSNATAWLVEAEHHDGKLDLLAYARSVDPDFGLGQESGAERGRRKLGVDGRVLLSEGWSVTGSAWYDDSLTDASHRNAVQVSSSYRKGSTEARVGIARFADTLADGSKTNSTVLEAGAAHKFFGNKLELDASTSIALGKSESIDLPARQRLGARYSITPGIKLVGTYEIAKGDAIDARTFRAGFEAAPWSGARLVTSLGSQSVSEQGKRTFAAYGLSQSLPVGAHLTLDATLDGNKVLGGINPAAIINPAQPVASGGQINDSGSLVENFTAVTVGAAWRAGRWSATLRGEYRDGQYANRKGFIFGAIRQLGEGSVVGSGFSWTHATAVGGATTEVMDAAISAAHRPADSHFAFLTKIAFRSDKVTGAVDGLAGAAGQTALIVNGDAQSRRLIGSVSGNWSPQGHVDGDRVQRSELGVFAAVRYNFDRYEGFALAGTTLLGGLDAHIGIGDRIEIGGTATIRASLVDHTTSFAFGPQIGIVPADNVLLTLGYNISGFRDRDFAAARTTDKGVFASIRLKFDNSTLAMLGLGR
ncbi:hypothetical protein [Novosphingobium lentum]|uniref:hypothetical protein n=1 Tax=Novosphingobium lentum TaxID=145287 RepID=UPI001FDF5FC6|nr:hypothetical protein [Novosphingobium lentum]